MHLAGRYSPARRLYSEWATHSIYTTFTRTAKLRDGTTAEITPSGISRQQAAVYVKRILREQSDPCTREDRDARAARRKARQEAKDFLSYLIWLGTLESGGAWWKHYYEKVNLRREQLQRDADTAFELSTVKSE